MIFMLFVSLQPSNSSHMGGNIWSLWSETPSINHTNYPSPCNIYDNAANDTALITSIPHLFWWSDTQIRKKPLPSHCCWCSIHHHLSFLCDECYIYGALFQLFVPLCHSTSAAHVKSQHIETATAHMHLFFISQMCFGGNALLSGLCVHKIKQTYEIPISGRLSELNY